MVKKAFLSGLGKMGKRHLFGLLEAGFIVSVYDTQLDAAVAALHKEQSVVPWDRIVLVQSLPREEFDVAVFSEPAPFRIGNFQNFLSGSRAKRFLLEKPITCDVKELDLLSNTTLHNGISPSQIFVDLPWRTIPIVTRIGEACRHSNSFVFTVNGGAKGWGCNGVHYLDLFLHFANGLKTDVKTVELCAAPVPSDRDLKYRDFGGLFLIKSGCGHLFCSLSSESSAPAAWSICGDHFAVFIDESNFSCRYLARDPVSQKPFHLYGKDYGVIEEGPIARPSAEAITREWANGNDLLPVLEEALPCHRLLFEILDRAEVKPPYFFT